MPRTWKLAAAVLLLAGICAGTTVAGTEGPWTASTDEDSVLEASMETLNKGFRTIRRMMRGDIDHAKLLEILPGMQASAIKAKGEMPHIIEHVESEKDKATQLKAFRLQMIGLAQELLNLEKAALGADGDAAKATVEKIRAIQKQGHDEFQEDEDH